MCTVLLPLGVNPTAVIKYILSYHIYYIISYHILSYIYHIISHHIIYHIKAFTGPIKFSSRRCLDGQLWGVVYIPLYFHSTRLYRLGPLISPCTHKNYMYYYRQLYYQSEVGPVCKFRVNFHVRFRVLKFSFVPPYSCFVSFVPCPFQMVVFWIITTCIVSLF